MRLNMLPRKAISLITALAVAWSVLPVAAEGETSGTSIPFYPVDVDIDLRNGAQEDSQKAESLLSYSDSDVVRVSIVLEGQSTAEAYSGQATTNAEALNYRAQLENAQNDVAERIETDVLGGQELDVVWNLTYATNRMSAYVQYGQIEDIKAIEGIKDVVIERRYDVPETRQEETNPEMYSAGDMTGSPAAWASGYTGIGETVAIVDTGVDTDHQSFDPSAYTYSIALLAGKAGMTYEEYAEANGIMTKKDIEAVLEQLNAYKREETCTADDFYINNKIPFGYNYVDRDFDVTHDNDGQGSHGSHVAGIAAANKYVPNGDGTYANALQTVFVQGQAPDAQILAMKVFGKGGGAYDSDYMAAIEDAMILGAASVNLSLGSASTGYSFSDEYQDIMDSLEGSYTVASISAGNRYEWTHETAYDYLVNDDINYSTGGSPGTFDNSFTTASINNVGSVGDYVSLDGDMVFYTNGASASNEVFTSLAADGDKEFEYVAIEGFGTDEDFAALGQDILGGKIAICSRGSTSFYQKANAAVANGAAATLIYNNTTGTITMNMTGYSYTNPAASITKADGLKFIEKGEKKETADGTVYYTGKVTVAQKPGASKGDADAKLQMSDFSSWGITQALTLTPEITTPGGNIYSINGVDPSGKAYENNSGTSMAAPQNAGMSAVLAQYVRETGLAEKTGLANRTIVQSLIMSTAIPVVEYRGEEEPANWYGLGKQGAGLANVENAINAKSLILMDESATKSASDGKVKAELGDDPEKNGVYVVKYSINNITDTDLSYTLDADVFTQAIAEDEDYKYLATYTTPIDATVAFKVDGVDATDAITVAANASVDVEATITLSDAAKANFAENYPSGAYVEAYLFVKPTETEDGALEDVEYSIPVLAFYGSWGTASMFEPGTYVEFWNNTDDQNMSNLEHYMNMPKQMYSMARLESYIISYDYPFYNNYFDVNGYPYAINAFASEVTPAYDYEAISSKAVFDQMNYTPIRNGAYAVGYIENSDGEIIYQTEATEYAFARFYHPDYGWVEYGNNGEGLYYFGGHYHDFSDVDLAQLGVKEGDKLKFVGTVLPEYYTLGNEEFSVEDAKALVDAGLVDGCTSVFNFVVDDTEPKIVDIQSVNDITTGKTTLKVAAVDNEQIAAVIPIYVTDDGYSFIDRVVPEKALPGTEQTCEIDITGYDVENIVVAVCDYAENEIDVALSEKLSEDNLGKMYNVTIKGGENGTVDPEGTFNALEGTEFEVTATPEQHYVAKATINGEEVEINDNKFTFTVEKDTTVEVVFEQVEFTVTATANEGGTIDPAGVTSYKELSEATYTITPDEHYFVDSITLNGEAIEAVDGKVTFVVDEDKTLDVVFKLADYTVTATASEGGTIDPVGETSYAALSEATYTITPDEHYLIDTLTLDGEAIEAVDGKVTFVVDADKTLDVTFKLADYTVTATAGEGGTISPEGETVYTALTKVAYTITPDEFYEIDTVTLNGEPVENPGNMVSFIVDGNKTIEATFKLINYTVTASTGRNGSISPAGEITTTAKDEIEFTLTPDAGYIVDVVLVNGKPIEVVDNKFTVTVTSDTTVNAFFAEDPDVVQKVLVTFLKEGEGDAAVSVEGEVDAGTEVTLTYSDTATNGYVIDYIKVNGVAMEGTDGKLTVVANRDTVVNVVYRLLHIEFYDGYWYENGVIQGTVDDENGVRDTQYNQTVRGREIYDPATDRWYWLDAIYGGLPAKNKEVWMPYIYQDEEPGSTDGKWVRYDAEGGMIKGWYTNDNGTYYYDLVTGAMAKGTVTIDNKEYTFDEITGIRLN